MRAPVGIAVLVAGVLALTSCGGGSSEPKSASSSIPGSDRFPVPAVNTVDPRHPSGCTTWPLVSMREVKVPDSSQHAVAYTYRDPRGHATEVEHRPLPGQTVDPLSMTWRQLRFYWLLHRPPAGVLRHLWRMHYADWPGFDPVGICTHGLDYIDAGGGSDVEYNTFVCGTPFSRFPAKYPPTLLTGHRVRRLSLRVYQGIAVLTTYSCASGPRVTFTPSTCLGTVELRARAADGRVVGLLARPRCSLVLSLNGHPAMKVVLHRPNGRVVTRPYHF